MQNDCVIASIPGIIAITRNVVADIRHSEIESHPLYLSLSVSLSLALSNFLFLKLLFDDHYSSILNVATICQMSLHSLIFQHFSS